MKAGYTPAEAEIRQIVRICHLVEGSPLALELAANWLRVLTCPEIAAEIQRSFDFLTATTRDFPERHRSMRAVFDPSWKMLEPNEQAALERLSVFRGDFERSAAEAVAKASVHVLAGLVDKSALRMSGSGRYRLHELIRQYAAEKLALKPPDLTTVRDRHSRFYAHFLRHQNPRLQSDKLPAAVAEIAAELGNIRAAWGWATVADYDGVLQDISDSARALRIFYGRRSWFHEGLEMCGVFIERLRLLQSRQGTAELTVLLGQLTLWEGIFYHYLGNIPASIDHFRRSHEMLAQQDPSAPYAIKDLGGAFHLARYGRT